MATYQILYWREIPAQLRIYEDGRPKSYSLPQKFQVEIDRVAMEEGLAGTDDYLDQWQWSEKLEMEGEGSEVAARLATELEKVLKKGG